jgi:ABC-type methionine transport system permease subunit
MTHLRVLRSLGYILLLLQGGLVGVFLYHMVDTYVTPYKSEWLTPDAFVPYLILFALFFGFCMFLTWRVICDQRRGVKWNLIPLAVITIAPYAAMIHDALLPT